MRQNHETFAGIGFAMWFLSRKRSGLGIQKTPHSHRLVGQNRLSGRPLQASSFAQAGNFHKVSGRCLFPARKTGVLCPVPGLVAGGPVPSVQFQ
jgi:hypothetical protein